MKPESDQSGFISPDAYAQSAFELVDDKKSISDLLAHYVWEWGECSIICEYAPENETSRAYYILSIKGQEFVRSNYGENIVTVLSMSNPDNDYETLLAAHNHAVHIFHWEALANACPPNSEDLINEFKSNALNLRELWNQ